MRMTTKTKEQERLAFAEEAAAAFATSEQLATYGPVTPGSFLALRWGMGNDCVLVVLLDEYDEPVNYQQLARQQTMKGIK